MACTTNVIRWPGKVKAGATRSAIVQNIDFAPTILDVAGADIPDDMHGKSLVTQREVGIDTESFEVALRNTLRQAPDVILMGEVRDLETAEVAIRAALTGAALSIAAIASAQGGPPLAFFPMVDVQLAVHRRHGARDAEVPVQCLWCTINGTGFGKFNGLQAV